MFGNQWRKQTEFKVLGCGASNSTIKVTSKTQPASCHVLLLQLIALWGVCKMTNGEGKMKKKKNIHTDKIPLRGLAELNPHRVPSSCDLLANIVKQKISISTLTKFSNQALSVNREYRFSFVSSAPTPYI